MRIIIVGLVLILGACASAPEREPERGPAETHVCTQSPDGLAECREVAPS
ncbi:hypothetical protein [Hoeflea sp. BAL378]|nr:hypothetical protein [Hoeflea sp. BAL378]